MENQDRVLHTLDFVVFGVILGISLAIGVYHGFTGDKQRTTREYFVGNRQLKPLPVSNACQ
jgi:Na+/proline symporter